MRQFSGYLVLGMGLLLSGCATTPRSVPVTEMPPEMAIEKQAEVARDAGGFVAIGKGSSLTLPFAQDKAVRRARLDLSEIVVARVNQLQAEYLEMAGADRQAAEAWFTGVSRYLRDSVLLGARSVVEKSQMDADLATVWVLMVEDPAVIVQAMEIRGAADRQLYALVRSSPAYRALLAEAERFHAYRVSQGRTRF